MPDSIIRPRQRVVTAISPHSGNPNVLIPSRPQNALAAFAQSHAMSAGRATPVVGYDTTVGPIGTLDPLTFRGRTVVRMSIDEVLDIFKIELEPSGLGQQYWKRIRFETSDGFWDDTEILSADVTVYTDTGSLSSWEYKSFTRVFVNGIQYRMDWDWTL